MSDIKRMDIAEFRELGLLQEVNRRLLHPLGLALEVVIEDGVERLGGVWDYRDDPEGMCYGPGMLDPAKYHRVQAMLDDAQHRREDALGFFIQPLWPEEEEP